MLFKTLGYLLALILTIGAGFGILAPWLISASSTIAVGLGFVTIIATIVVVILLVRSYINMIAKHTSN